MGKIANSITRMVMQNEMKRWTTRSGRESATIKRSTSGEKNYMEGDSMSQRFVAKKKDSYIPNPAILRQSILELRQVYSDMDEMEYCLMYERKYGVKWQEVKHKLRSVENEPTV